MIYGLAHTYLLLSPLTQSEFESCDHVGVSSVIVTPPALSSASVFQPGADAGKDLSQRSV